MSFYDYGDKSLASKYAALKSPGELPTIEEVPASADGSGLELSGWFATWHEDSSGEAFLPNAFNAALATALARGLPVLYNHNKSEVPIGFVRTCEVRPGGLWGSVILPCPSPGTKAAEIYTAVKNRLVTYFSVGGFWSRSNIGGKVKLMCDRFVELSLCSTPVNQHAGLAGVAAIQGVKSLGDEWVPTDINGRIKRDISDHQRHKRELDDIKFAVTIMRLREQVRS
jgi:HK97 family phage prohead protease